MEERIDYFEQDKDNKKISLKPTKLILVFCAFSLIYFSVIDFATANFNYAYLKDPIELLEVYAVEFIIFFVCSTTTYSLTAKKELLSIRYSFIRLLIYTVVCLFLVCGAFIAIDMYYGINEFDIHVDLLRHIPDSLHDGIVFLLVWILMHFRSKQKLH